MAGPPVIVINSDGSNNQQGGGNRPPRRRKNRADKRAENEKKKKADAEKKKKELTMRYLWAIGIFTIPLMGLGASFFIQSFGTLLIKITELALLLMKAIVGAK